MVFQPGGMDMGFSRKPRRIGEAIQADDKAYLSKAGKKGAAVTNAGKKYEALVKEGDELRKQINRERDFDNNILQSNAHIVPIDPEHPGVADGTAD